MKVEYILMPLIIIWSPLFFSYILSSIWLTFYTLEFLGKHGRMFYEKFLNKIESYLRYRIKLIDNYYKIAFILSYVVFGIMVLCKILGIKIK